ncbi:MAG: hypothetical protein Q8R82_04970 [Hyphomonadaceae bacterium]|nr:hypothetical protein [Hyphomonadaceae bacterium]
MRASTSRFVYCLGLLAVTACAVLPEAIPMLGSPTHTEAAPLTTEIRLAQAIRGRVELAAAVTPDDPTMVEAVATEAALRDLAFSDDVAATRRDLIYALSDELSDALADREQASTRLDAAHPELVKADAVVTGLTAAINREVHRNRV